MTNLFETDPVHPSELHAGSVIYYADAHTYGNQYLHGLQVAKVMVSNEKSFILDNGRRFNPDTGKEITRGNEGYLYPYTSVTKDMVQNAESKLFLVNEVLRIDFSSLTTQQLSMILDVARGAFTQVTAHTPCGGCSEGKTTVEAQPIITNIRDLVGTTVDVAGIDIEVEQEASEVTAPIAFADVTYEMLDSELDDDDADDNDESINGDEASQDPLEG